MVRIRPHSEISFGYLGTARLAGNRTGAIRAFERALELNPRYQYAGCMLFDLHFASGQLAEAEEILARFRHHTAGQPLVACRVQLAVRRSDERTARAALQEICLACVPDPTPLNIAVQSMYEAGWESPAAEVMEAIVDTGSAHTNLLACWAYLQGLRLDHSCVPRLRKLVKHDDRGRTAPGDFIRGLLDKGADSLALNFVQANAVWLRKYTPTWGAGGYALTRLGRYREAVEWNADWRDRQDAEPWMLINVAESLRALGRDVEAAEASHRSLALPTGEGQALHRLWLAIDAACEGDIATARERFSQVQPESLRPVDQFDWTLVASVIQMADAPSEARARVFAEVRRRLADAEGEAPQFASRAALKRAYRRCLAQIARSRGTLAAHLWYLYHWLLSW